MKPAEAVDRLLEAANQITDILSLEGERARVEKEKAAAEAEAKKAIAQSKLTRDAVEAARWLVSQRISSKTVFAWRTIATRLNLPTELLAQGSADALKQFGTLDAACRTKAAERDELTKQVEKLRAETTTLQAEEQRIQAALEVVAKGRQGRVQSVEKITTNTVNSVKNQAVAAIKATRDQFEETMIQADQYMATTIRRFEKVNKEAAELERDVDFARALRSSDPTPWLEVTAENWDAILFRFLEWAEVRRINIEMPIPDVVKKSGKGSIDYPTLNGQYRLPLRAIVGWLKAGLKGVPATNVTIPWGSALTRLTARNASTIIMNQKTGVTVRGEVAKRGNPADL